MATNDPNKPGGEVHGTSKVTPLGDGQKKSALGWLWWLLGALLLLALLFLLLRSCSDDDRAATATTTTTTTATAAAPATPAVAVETVTLPGGQTIDLTPQTLNYELQRFLGSTEAAPRTFTFENLNFATSSAELPTDAAATVSALAQIMQAYPNARARIDGYADARGSDPANAQLGARRAEAVVRALVAAGVPADRVTATTGGETNPVDTNATAAGQAENRRTELTVTAK